MPRGAIINGNLRRCTTSTCATPSRSRSSCRTPGTTTRTRTKGLHPWDGVTEPNYVLGPNAKGTRPISSELDESAKYSWIKAPRWRGHAMEVGPLARYVVGYAQGQAGDQGADRQAC